MSKKIYDEYKVIEMLYNKTQKEVGKIFGISQTTVGKIAKKNGIKFLKSRVNMSKINLDISYFEKIDSPKKAYWLGYICSDGCINHNLDKVSLTSKDEEIINKFREDISSGHKIDSRDIYDKRTGNIYHRYSIQITNRTFVSNILSHGLTDYKPLNTKLPNINKDLIPYFIAGMFDADGSLSINEKGYVRTSLIGTMEMLEEIDKYLLDNYDIIPIKKQRVTNNQNTWKSYWYKYSKRFLNIIYSGDGDIYMSRKCNKFKKI